MLLDTQTNKGEGTGFMNVTAQEMTGDGKILQSNHLIKEYYTI